MKEDRLSEHLQHRPGSLLAAKERGQKVVGYFPGGYVPEEIIYAAGAVPCVCARAEATALPRPHYLRYPASYALLPEPRSERWRHEPTSTTGWSIS